MFQVIEVIGVSKEGFSQAVEAGVNDVAKTKKNIHFFEVVEQRGGVTDGKIREYQVKIKVAFIE